MELLAAKVFINILAFCQKLSTPFNPFPTQHIHPHSTTRARQLPAPSFIDLSTPVVDWTDKGQADGGRSTVSMTNVCVASEAPVATRRRSGKNRRFTRRLLNKRRRRRRG